MAGKSKREIVCILAVQGKKTKEIVAVTGLAERTVNQYRSDIGREITDSMIQNKMPLSLQIEWTETVNRIRRAYGWEPFPMP